MAGTSRKTGSRIGARAARLAVIGVLAALATLSTPGMASAGPGPSTGSVRGIIDCYTNNSDGSFDVVMGYVSTYSGNVNIPYGADNALSPARLQGDQPARFRSGTVHGAFTITLAANEIGPQAEWALDGTVLEFGAQGAFATRCPGDTVLPADGNGTGTAVALGAAGLVGAAVLYRFRRELARLAEGATSPRA
jgi:hypothetical protein